MKSPVIFLAFANNDDAHLPLLEEERKAIKEHLVPLANRQYFQLFDEASANAEDLVHYLSEYNDQVVIFHYGGHADSDRIILTDGSVHSKGVAQALALQDNLKLVFLNGCSTYPQVKELLELGIDAVIATRVSIGDDSAMEFANVFYRALSTQHSLEEAFRMAAANYLMRKGANVGIYRGIGLMEEAREGSQDLPWGLYVQEEESDHLSWRLPRKSTSSFIIRGAGYRYQAGTVNQKIIETLADAIAPYSETVNDLVENARRRERDPRLRDLRAAVIDSFPTPIGTHLRKLLLSEKTNVERLQRIVNVYMISSQMLAYTLLSQLWDELHKKKDLVIPEDQHVLIRNFLNMGGDAVELYDYIQLIRALADVFESLDIPYFIREFDELRTAFYQDEELQKAYLFLEEMRAELQGTVAADEVESFCVQAEDNLCQIFRYLGFSAKYKMVTIKSIELLKKRFESPAYRHNMVVLDRITAAFGVLDEVLTSPHFTENDSVVLIPVEDALSPYLNLSPFVLDENALSGQPNSKVFFYRYAGEGQIHYQLTDNLKDILIIDDD
ncbi:MAG: CHAT domain-containing protein, partial [Lewinella sp.]|nr:CHAT domain-containing protein [Lewinella sp.]